MRLAVCAFRYFPHGGLQRDLADVLACAVSRGHHVVLYVADCSGPPLPGVVVRHVPVHAWTMAGRWKQYVRGLRSLMQSEHHDVVLGFNKMPGLDVYYAADVCFAAKQRGWRRCLYVFERYRVYHAYEQAVMSHAHCCFLTRHQASVYAQHHPQFTAERAVLVAPPQHPEPSYPLTVDQQQALDSLRTSRSAGQHVVLLAGAAFGTKGFDRALRAMAALPSKQNYRVLWVGKQPDNHAAKWVRRARSAGVAVEVWGSWDHMSSLYAWCDYLLHPARTENTGTVLIEALKAGVVVLTTANCGYAEHVRRSGGGQVVEEPFDQSVWNAAVAQWLSQSSAQRLQSAARGRAYMARLHEQQPAMPEQVMNVVEACVA